MLNLRLQKARKAPQLLRRRPAARRACRTSERPQQGPTPSTPVVKARLRGSGVPRGRSRIDDKALNRRSVGDHGAARTRQDHRVLGMPDDRPVRTSAWRLTLVRKQRQKLGHTARRDAVQRTSSRHCRATAPSLSRVERLSCSDTKIARSAIAVESVETHDLATSSSARIEAVRSNLSLASDLVAMR